MSPVSDDPERDGEAEGVAVKASSNPPPTKAASTPSVTGTAPPRNTKRGLGSDPGALLEPATEKQAPKRPERRTLGRYEICFELASGGMGSLYLATFRGPAGFEKVVALKQIHAHLAKEGGLVHMFLDEARIASQISHANVCSVFDFGEAEGNYFLAMEYLMGEPLSRVRTTAKRAGFLTASDYPVLVARLIADACEGLHAAHELKDPQGRPLSVVHRDISPANLFVTYDGVTKVLDFGVASATQRLQQTSTGQLKGKFSYMAPEQLKGQRADRRADVWALGVTLWELLTGERLFRGDSEASTMFQIVSDPIPRPTSIRPSLPEELDDIVMKAVDRSLGSRYQTARELGRDLTRFVARSEEPVGLAEVAEWLERMFPEGRGRKRQLVELALKVADSEVPKVEAQEGSTSVSVVVPTSTETNMTARLIARILPAAKRWRAASVVALVAAVGIAVAVAAPWRAPGDGADAEGVGAPAAAPPEAGPEEELAPEEPAAEAAPPAPEEATEPAAEARAGSGAEVTPAEPEAAETATAAEASASGESETRQARRTARERRRERARSARAPEQAAAVEGSGIVNVVTPNGWALVSVGGKDLGETPVRVRLPAGRHVFLVRPFGQGTPVRRSLKVEPDATQRLVVPLSP